MITIHISFYDSHYRDYLLFDAAYTWRFNEFATKGFYLCLYVIDITT